MRVPSARSVVGRNSARSSAVSIVEALDARYVLGPTCRSRGWSSRAPSVRTGIALPWCGTSSLHRGFRAGAAPLSPRGDRNRSTRPRDDRHHPPGVGVPGAVLRAGLGESTAILRAAAREASVRGGPDSPHTRASASRRTAAKPARITITTVGSVSPRSGAAPTSPPWCRATLDGPPRASRLTRLAQPPAHPRLGGRVEEHRVRRGLD